MSEKYITKVEILEWINVQLEDDEIDDIPNRIMMKGHKKVDAELFRLGAKTIPAKVDANGFLKEAASCFILAMACNARIITQTSGEVLSERFLDVEYRFQRVNPLFFFATGSSKPFMDLLPAETLRMLGFSFLRAYMKWAFVQATGRSKAQSIAVRDTSSRGRYWNEPVTDIAAADAEIGDYRDPSDYE